MATRPVPDSAWIIAALLAVATAVACLGMIPNADSMTAGFALLILVLLAAAIAPIWIANTVAVASTLSLNYFFFPPVGTFTFTKPQDSISLLAFLVAAFVSTKISAPAGVRFRDGGARLDEAARQIEQTFAFALGSIPSKSRQAHSTSALLASLSHDLKTPLTAILFATENLRSDLPPFERRAHADAALAELTRLERLFEAREG